MRALIADGILFVHFAFVLFVVGSLPLIWIGAGAGWRWVRRFRFRLAHLAAIAFVAGQSLLGMMCPLTVWEARLREREPERSFIAEWVHRLLYYDLPEPVFTTAYLLFAAAVAATLRLVPPVRRDTR